MLIVVKSAQRCNLTCVSLQFVNSAAMLKVTNYLHKSFLNVQDVKKRKKKNWKENGTALIMNNSVHILVCTFVCMCRCEGITLAIQS